MVWKHSADEGIADLVENWKDDFVKYQLGFILFTQFRLEIYFLAGTVSRPQTNMPLNGCSDKWCVFHNLLSQNWHSADLILHFLCVDHSIVRRLCPLLQLLRRRSICSCYLEATVDSWGYYHLGGATHKNKSGTGWHFDGFLGFSWSFSTLYVNVYSYSWLQHRESCANIGDCWYFTTILSPWKNLNVSCTNLADKRTS